MKDPAAGDYTVTINSPQAKAALDLYIDLLKNCGPPNYGTLGQGDVIQLLATGKARDGRRRHSRRSRASRIRRSRRSSASSRRVPLPARPQRRRAAR